MDDSADLAVALSYLSDPGLEWRTLYQSTEDGTEMRSWSSLKTSS